MGRKLQWLSVAQLCPTRCDPMNYSPPGSSDHGIFPGKNTKVGSIPFSAGSSLPRDRTQVSCIASKFFTSWAFLGQRRLAGTSPWGCKKPDRTERLTQWLPRYSLTKTEIVSTYSGLASLCCGEVKHQSIRGGPQESVSLSPKVLCCLFLEVRSRFAGCLDLLVREVISRPWPSADPQDAPWKMEALPAVSQNMHSHHGSSRGSRFQGVSLLRAMCSWSLLDGRATEPSQGLPANKFLRFWRVGGGEAITHLEATRDLPPVPISLLILPPFRLKVCSGPPAFFGFSLRAKQHSWHLGSHVKEGAYPGSLIWV